MQTCLARPGKHPLTVSMTATRPGFGEWASTKTSPRNECFRRPCERLEMTGGGFIFELTGRAIRSCHHAGFDAATICRLESPGAALLAAVRIRILSDCHTKLQLSVRANWQRDRCLIPWAFEGSSSGSTPDHDVAIRYPANILDGILHGFHLFPGLRIEFQLKCNKTVDLSRFNETVSWICRDTAMIRPRSRTISTKGCALTGKYHTGAMWLMRFAPGRVST